MPIQGNTVLPKLCLVMSVQAWNAAESDAKWRSSTEACFEAENKKSPQFPQFVTVLAL